MNTSILRQDLTSQLNKLRKNKGTLPYNDFRYADWKDLKVKVRGSLSNLKLGVKLYEFLAYILLAITGIISLIKVFEFSFAPDLNKAALLIFLTLTFTISAFAQKIRIERLEKQLLIIETLEKIDFENND